MFCFVSKKKYDELEARYRELKDNWSERCYAKILDAQAYERLQTKVIDLQKENKSLQEQIAHWKQMYADEVQKRIEMAQLMKNQ